MCTVKGLTYIINSVIFLNGKTEFSKDVDEPWVGQIWIFLHDILKLLHCQACLVEGMMSLLTQPQSKCQNQALQITGPYISHHILHSL